LKGADDFQVFRPQGGNAYLVLGDTGSQTDPCNSQLNSYPVNITVQAGDVHGGYVVKGWQGVPDFNGNLLFGRQREPTVGQIVIVPEA
jgi:hypothetical protein